MLGVNLADAASLVSRMEAVARSMAESTSRMETVAEKLTEGIFDSDTCVSVVVDLDDEEVHKTIQDYMKERRFRK